MNTFRGVAEAGGARKPRHRPDSQTLCPVAGQLPPDIARELRDVSAALQAVCERVAAHHAALTNAESLIRLGADPLTPPLDDASPFGRWTADAHGRFLTVSESFTTLVGRPRQACLGLGWLENVIDTDRDATRASWLQAVRDAAEWRCEYGLHCADGCVRYLLSRAVPVRDDAGRLIGWSGAHLDITERRRAQKQVHSLVTALRQRVAEQTGRVWLLQDVAVAANEAVSIADLLRYALRRVGEHLHASVGTVHLYDERENCLVPAGIDYVAQHAALPAGQWPPPPQRIRPGQGLAGRVLQHGEPAWVDDIADTDACADDARQIARTGLRTALAVGILAGNRVVAVLEFFFENRREVDQALLGLLANVGSQLGRVAERKQWERELAEAIWRQQQRFGQDLHDGIGQQLTGLAFLARSLQHRLEARDLPEAESGESVAQGIQNILGQVRQLARGLFPVEVDGRGLMSALIDLAEQTQQRCGLPCRLVCEEPVPVDDNHVATHLFRIAQEAINNAVKHAQASELTITLAAMPDELILCVADDGVGVDTSAAEQEGIGLRVMRHRAELIHARLEIEPGDSGGTLVTCRLRKDHHHDREQGQEESQQNPHR